MIGGRIPAIGVPLTWPGLADRDLLDEDSIQLLDENDEMLRDESTA